MPDDTLILLNNGAEESIVTLEEFQRGIEVFQKQQATWSMACIWNFWHGEIRGIDSAS